MAIRKNNSSTVLKEDGFALIQSYIDRIDKAHTLDEVFNLHKLLWNDGIRHSGFGPDRRGMFRCQDISTMSKDEVYLGNVFGIWTNTLSFFEKGRDDGTVDTVTYRQVCSQYKNQLSSNLRYIRSQFYDCGVNRTSLRSMLEVRINGFLNDDVSGSVHVHDIEPGITPGKPKDVTFSFNDRTYRSSILVIIEDDRPRVFIPAHPWGPDTDFLPPHVDSRADLKSCKWTDISDQKVYGLESSLFRDRLIVSEGSRKRCIESVRRQTAMQAQKYKGYFKL